MPANTVWPWLVFEGMRCQKEADRGDQSHPKSLSLVTLKHNQPDLKVCVFFFFISWFFFFSLPLRDFCQHLYLQPGGHCHRKIQRHLQPPEIPCVADALTRLPCHHGHLGAVAAHHGALPSLQRPQVFPEGQQHSGAHVPPGLAHPASRADVVSALSKVPPAPVTEPVLIFIFLLIHIQCEQMGRACVRELGMTCLHEQGWEEPLWNITGRFSRVTHPVEHQRLRWLNSRCSSLLVLLWASL